MSIFKKLFQSNKPSKTTNNNKFYTFPVANIIRETERAVSLVFDKPEEGFDFKPGQYLTLKKEVDGEELRRAYSLCNLPEENTLKVTVKETKDGYFSKYVNNELEIGDLVDVFPPRGQFTFSPDSNNKRHIVCFAGGSGITPISSIVQSLLTNEPESRVTLFYGNRTQDDIIFKSYFEELEKRHGHRFKLVHILSDEDVSDFTTYYGFIDAEKVSEFSKEYFQTTTVDTFYLCGPGNMTAIISEALHQLGVAEGKIKTELFSAPLPDDESDEEQKNEVENDDVVEGATIYAKYSGEERKIIYQQRKKSVLDTALDAGMSIPFSCLNGVCSTCSARLVKGTVTMDQNFALEEEDLDAGYILTCQSHPTSKEIEVDWDDNRI